MYHPNSLYGKLQALIDSVLCICKEYKKRSGDYVCRNCYMKLREDGFSTYRLSNGDKEDRLDSFLDAIEQLGHNVKEI